MSYEANAIAVKSKYSVEKPDIGPIVIKRPAVGDKDVRIDVKFCGVCHSDVHSAAEDWGTGNYPLVPGHEVAGVVAAVGPKVTKFAVGDHVGVGCYVDACEDCRYCNDGDDHLCANGVTLTFGSKPVHGRAGPADETTKGGYSSQMTVNEYFVVKIPSSYPLEKAGPLLCAGITVWTPLRRYNVGPGKNVGVFGLGGLGMMAIKLAKGLGATVTAVTTSEGKKKAVLAMGADEVMILSDEAAMEKAAGTIDVAIDTISVHHDAQTYLNLLAKRGVLVQVGGVFQPMEYVPFQMIMKETIITGSNIGHTRAAQECVSFCAEKGIFPETEVVPCSKVPEIYRELMGKNTSARRYVLDIANTLKAP